MLDAYAYALIRFRHHGTPPHRFRLILRHDAISLMRRFCHAPLFIFITPRRRLIIFAA